jgi:hypothetical protein
MDGLWKMITLGGGFEALSDDQLRVALQWYVITSTVLLYDPFIHMFFTLS